ncbi:MAG: hypothetical protein MUC81_07625 [Bacteroidia bacterium]|jgi:hypothetical protein|nr:hypothetical protein [Bacteroidia bacterium]
MKKQIYLFILSFYITIITSVAQTPSIQQATLLLFPDELNAGCYLKTDEINIITLPQERVLFVSNVGQLIEPHDKTIYLQNLNIPEFQLQIDEPEFFTRLALNHNLPDEMDINGKLYINGINQEVMIKLTRTKTGDKISFIYLDFRLMGDAINLPQLLSIKFKLKIPIP